MRRAVEVEHRTTVVTNMYNHNINKPPISSLEARTPTPTPITKSIKDANTTDHVIIAACESEGYHVDFNNGSHTDDNYDTYE